MSAYYAPMNNIRSHSISSSVEPDRMTPNVRCAVQADFVILPSAPSPFRCALPCHSHTVLSRYLRPPNIRAPNQTLLGLLGADHQTENYPAATALRQKKQSIISHILYPHENEAVKW